MSTPFLSFNPGDLIEDSHVEQFIEPIQNLEDGKTWYAEATGSPNAFAVDLDPAPSAYAAGMLVHFKANNGVTGATTIDLNSLGTKSLVKEGNTSLVTGDIVSGQMVSAIYDGTNFQLISPVLNPTVTAVSEPKNILVYSEVTPEQSSGTFTDLTLPSFNFDNSKSYLMEITLIAHGGTTPTLRVTLDDGTTSHAYPSASDVLRARPYNESFTATKKLPNLSGSHTVTVSANYIGHAMVKFYEINSNLVYADLTPSQYGGTYVTSSLDDFTATSGHTYLLRMTTSAYQGSPPSMACYLDDGVDTVGIPQDSPTTKLVSGPNDSGTWSVERVIDGISGTYSVTVRGRQNAGVSVEIYDIT